jgi:hypothetical protein
VLLKKVLTTAAVTVTAAALTLGVAGGVSYADGPGTRSTEPTATASASPSPSATASDTSTATIRLSQQNVVITALTLSDTATSTITVEDRKHSPRTITWNVPREVTMSGYYKKVSDLRVGFTIHIAGPRTGDAAPTADRIVAPGRNKKVHLQHVTVTAVSGSAGTITVRDKKGRTSTWDVRSAKVQGKGRRTADLSTGDVVSLRGQAVEGSSKGAASVVQIEKDVKPAKKKSKGK